MHVTLSFQILKFFLSKKGILLIFYHISTLRDLRGSSNMSMISITLWRSEIGNFYNRSRKVACSKLHSSKLHSSLRSLQQLLIILAIFFYELFNLNFSFVPKLSIILLVDLIHPKFSNFLKASYCFRTNRKKYLLIGVYSFNLFLFIISILRSGDIESNPGPRSSYCESLSICHWNLGSLSTNNFIKKDLLSAFNSIHNFDIIFLSETFLDSSFAIDNADLVLQNYTLFRADHPLDVKRGGVCVYYKSCLPINVLNISMLSECIILELSLEDKNLFFSSLYRSPSQSPEEFEHFLENFEHNLQRITDLNPFLVTVLGDFNAKSSNWWCGDKTSHEGLQIDSLASFYGLYQLISQPTHVLENSSSCIDLIFTSQPNLVTHSGVYSSLHNNCHHNIVFAKFNLKIEYPPPFERLVWNYGKANTDLIRRAAVLFDWENAFMSLDINHKIKLFNDTLINIFSNFCPYKTIVCNDNEPPWLTDEIKEKIREKDIAFIHYQNSNKNQHETIVFNELVNQLSEEIKDAKYNYYSDISEKLNNPTTCRKKYWSILKTLLNGNKVPLIPPLNIGNQFIIDFKEKAEAFNVFFSKQCTPINNGSHLPNIINLITDQTLQDIVFSTADINNIIKNLDTSKAHGYDGISVRMVKIFGESICKPLEIIFRNCIEYGVFPEIWKRLISFQFIHKMKEI